MDISTLNNHLPKPEVNIVWLRRDLRLDDNAALYYALKSNKPVLILFIFDLDILKKLSPNDARVSFIYERIVAIKTELLTLGSDLMVQHGKTAEIWEKLSSNYNINAVFTNNDYEPYARNRDEQIAAQLRLQNINFISFKDQVIFEKDEILKSDKSPYTVFTPFFKQWQLKLNSFYIKAYPTQKYFHNLFQTTSLAIPSLTEIGFEKNSFPFPKIEYLDKLQNYATERDFPALNSTTHLGLHLRFGTISIRQLVKDTLNEKAQVFLSELAWREFYMSIIWHFPYTATNSFKKPYDNIKWRNNEAEFTAWCNGETGYPIVDAGMRQLNQTGWMHNRVRMIVASFLTKHLLIDWRWGEQYFAEKLLDYELASNVGGWQWAAGCGNDAAPYFRIFNPELQTKRFDKNLEYIKKWIPEYGTKKYTQPIVEHTFARNRVLKIYKEALA